MRKDRARRGNGFSGGQEFAAGKYGTQTGLTEEV